MAPLTGAMVTQVFASETLSLQMQSLLCESYAFHWEASALGSTCFMQGKAAPKGSFIQPMPFPTVDTGRACQQQGTQQRTS